MCIRDRSLCELIVGGKEGLQPIEKTVIDRCVRLVYREMAVSYTQLDVYKRQHDKWVKRLFSYNALKIKYDKQNGNKEVWEPAGHWGSFSQWSRTWHKADPTHGLRHGLHLLLPVYQK